jgi:hypothetical protein
MLRAVPLCLFLLLSACGAADDGARASLEEGERDDEAGTTRASREGASAAGGAGTTAIDPPAAEAPRPSMMLFRLTEPTEAEDGAGHTATSERAVAIDLDASRFPPRALDPVLTVGTLRFVHYRHPRIGTLRFVAASHELLVDGAEVSIQYGDDASSRVVLTDALVVPSEVRR